MFFHKLRKVINLTVIPLIPGNVCYWSLFAIFSYSPMINERGSDAINSGSTFVYLYIYIYIHMQTVLWVYFLFAVLIYFHIHPYFLLLRGASFH